MGQEIGISDCPYEISHGKTSPDRWPLEHHASSAARLHNVSSFFAQFFAVRRYAESPCVSMVARQASASDARSHGHVAGGSECDALEGRDRAYLLAQQHMQCTAYLHEMDVV